jgi:hypothetical protein
MAQELLVFEWFCTCWCLRNELSVHKDGTCQSISIDQRPKNNIAMVFRHHFKKKSRKLCITNKYKYKIHNTIYPIQHSARSGKRCIEITNRDEYKNITTRNVVFFFAVHHGHRGLYDDTTNQLPRSDFWELSVNKDSTCQSISIDQRPKNNIAMVFREETTHWDEIIRNFIENKFVSRKFIN